MFSLGTPHIKACTHTWMQPERSPPWPPCVKQPHLSPTHSIWNTHNLPTLAIKPLTQRRDLYRPPCQQITEVVAQFDMHNGPKMQVPLINEFRFVHFWSCNVPQNTFANFYFSCLSLTNILHFTGLIAFIFN